MEIIHYHAYNIHFQITGPFLHIAAVAVMTFLSWFIVGRALSVRRKGRLTLHGKAQGGPEKFFNRLA